MIAAELIGLPMRAGKVVGDTPIVLASVQLDCLLDVGETMTINGNNYTVFKRGVSFVTEGAGDNSDIKAETKYGLGQRYTITLEARPKN